MAGPTTTLREIHRLRGHARDLQNRIDTGPRQLTALKNAVAREEEALHQAHEALKRLKVTIHDKDVSVKQTVAPLQKHEKQIGEIISKKEYDALKIEIATHQERIRKLEDEALLAMGEAEDRTAQLAALEDAVKKAKAAQTTFEKEYQERIDSWKQQWEAAQKQVIELETGLPDDIRVFYERAIRNMGADALALVEGRNCLNCYTDITAQMHNELLREQFVLCKNCGRILYLAAALPSVSSDD